MSKDKGKPNLFEVLKQMNDNDTNNGSKTLVVSPYFERARKVKKGGIVEMGCDESTFFELTANSRICLLLLIDKSEYRKLTDPQTTQSTLTS